MHPHKTVNEAAARTGSAAFGSTTDANDGCGSSSGTSTTSTNTTNTTTSISSTNNNPEQHLQPEHRSCDDQAGKEKNHRLNLNPDIPTTRVAGILSIFGRRSMINSTSKNDWTMSKKKDDVSVGKTKTGLDSSIESKLSPTSMSTAVRTRNKQRQKQANGCNSGSNDINSHNYNSLKMNGKGNNGLGLGALQLFFPCVGTTKQGTTTIATISTVGLIRVFVALGTIACIVLTFWADSHLYHHHDHMQKHHTGSFYDNAASQFAAVLRGSIVDSNNTNTTNTTRTRKTPAERVIRVEVNRTGTQMLPKKAYERMVQKHESTRMLHDLRPIAKNLFPAPLLLLRHNISLERAMVFPNRNFDNINVTKTKTGGGGKDINNLLFSLRNGDSAADDEMCSCRNPGATMNCCGRRYRVAYKMEYPSNTKFNYFMSKQIHARVVGLFPLDHYYFDNLPRKDYRETILMRNIYSTIIAGYLSHADNKKVKECKRGLWKDQLKHAQSDNPTKVKWTPSYVLNPPARNRTLCEYMAEETLEQGLRAYIDWVFRSQYVVHLAQWAIAHPTLGLPEVRERTLIVCREDFEQTGNRTAGAQDTTEELIPERERMRIQKERSKYYQDHVTIGKEDDQRQLEEMGRQRIFKKIQDFMYNNTNRTEDLEYFIPGEDEDIDEDGKPRLSRLQRQRAANSMTKKEKNRARREQRRLERLKKEEVIGSTLRTKQLRTILDAINYVDAKYFNNDIRWLDSMLPCKMPPLPPPGSEEPDEEDEQPQEILDPEEVKRQRRRERKERRRKAKQEAEEKRKSSGAKYFGFDVEGEEDEQDGAGNENENDGNNGGVVEDTVATEQKD